MKKITSPVRLTALLACVALTASCTTTYDAYGSPRQSVDPGVALMGVAAAGLVGYALANDNDSHHQQNNYYRGRGYRRGYDSYNGGYSHGYGGGYYDSDSSCSY
jgi:hypothetical protein